MDEYSYLNDIKIVIKTVPADGSKPSTECPSIDAVTQAGKAHHKELNDIINLFDLIGKAIVKTDKSLKAESRTDINTQFSTFLERLHGKGQIFLQMFICRLVDNFSSYLAEVFREVIQKKPAILRSGEQIKLDYALQFTSMPDLVADLIDRKVTGLSYGGLVEIEKWCKEKLGVSIVTAAQERDDLIELIETRNVFVHNRGIIGEKYIRNVPNTAYIRGQGRAIDPTYLAHTVSVLLSCANDLDQRLAKKFSLIKDVTDSPRLPE